jgi:hypothetical protein
MVEFHLPNIKTGSDLPTVLYYLKHESPSKRRDYLTYIKVKFHFSESKFFRTRYKGKFSGTNPEDLMKELYDLLVNTSRFDKSRANRDCALSALKDGVHYNKPKWSTSGLALIMADIASDGYMHVPTFRSNNYLVPEVHLNALKVIEAILLTNDDAVSYPLRRKLAFVEAKDIDENVRKLARILKVKTENQLEKNYDAAKGNFTKRVIIMAQQLSDRLHPKPSVIKRQHL